MKREEVGGMSQVEKMTGDYIPLRPRRISLGHYRPWWDQVRRGFPLTYTSTMISFHLANSFVIITPGSCVSPFRGTQERYVARPPEYPNGDSHPHPAHHLFYPFATTMFHEHELRLSHTIPTYRVTRLSFLTRAYP